MEIANRNRQYTNGEIIILWQPRKCVHVTTCYKELRSVFDPLKRPWINALGAPTEQILAIIERCPTAALTFRWCDEQRNEEESSTKFFRDDISIFPALRDKSGDVDSAQNSVIANSVNNKTV